MLHIAREKIQKLKHWWLTIAFVGGFVLDILTLGRVDQLFAMLVLLAHIINAGVNLLLLYAATAGRFPESAQGFVTKYSALLVQFSFGSLLSGTLVFYGQSGSWSVTWPFLALVLGVMIGNELVHNRTQRLLLNLVIFFLGIFSYCVLFLPVLIKRMGPLVFVGSGIVALVIIFLYLRLLRLIIPRFVELHLRNIIFGLGMVFATLNFLYFGNIIPPIPLSLKHIDIYHSVQKVEGGYRVTYENAPWYKFWRDADTTFRRMKGDPVYCFASVFAPTAFSLEITHLWEHYDNVKGEWKERAKIPYAISGGSDRGYRGYSYLESAEDGAWRCTVTTARGQILGRETFKVVTEKLRKDLVVSVE